MGLATGVTYGHMVWKIQVILIENTSQEQEVPSAAGDFKLNNQL
jgi:hypothetical protein